VKEWKVVKGTQAEQPSEKDLSSSPTTVYLRRNIEQVAEEQGEGETKQTVTLWQYEERELTVEEYNQLQLISENTAMIVTSVTEFQKTTVIDEYTAQLIEEGVL